MTSRFAKLTFATAALIGALGTLPVLAQGKGESVKFQDYPGTGNMLMRVAISKGYCEKAGIKCELQTIAAAPLAAQAMMAKSIDSFFGPTVVMNAAIQKGAKMKMVVGGAVANVWILLGGNHMASPNIGKGFPAFMQDFKGKKIGVTARGAASEIFTAWMLVKAGMKADDVTYVAVGGPNTAYGALVSKQVDASMMFEPAGAMCDVLKTCKRVWTGSTDPQPAELFAMNGGGNGLVFTQEYIDKYPHVIAAVITAAKEAELFINNPANFDEVLKIGQQYFKFDMPKGDEVLASVLRGAVQTGAYRASINRKAIQAELDLLLAVKMIDKMPAIADLIYDKAP